MSGGHLNPCPDQHSPASAPPPLGSRLLSAWPAVCCRREYIPWLYHVMLVVNLIIGVLTAAFIFSFFAEIQNLHGSTVAGFTTTLYFFALASPMLSSLVMADSYGLAVSVINIPFMMAFLPMWILIGAYGLARFVDFTWGNRPHESESLDGARRDAYMKKTERLGLLIIFMYLGGNLLIATILIALSHVWKGNTLVIYLVLFGPYGLSAIGGLIFNTWYAVRYRWAETLANAFKLRPRVAGDVPCNRS